MPNSQGKQPFRKAVMDWSQAGKVGESGGAFLQDKMVKLPRYALLADWDLVLSRSCSDLLPESQQFRTAVAHW